MQLVPRYRAAVDTILGNPGDITAATRAMTTKGWGCTS
jgi:hypothetical protein